MTSHELAHALLAQDDLPVAVHAHGHTYHSEYHRLSHGPLQIAVAPGRVLNWSTDQRTILVGDMVQYKYPDAQLLAEGPREP